MRLMSILTSDIFMSTDGFALILHDLILIPSQLSIGILFIFFRLLIILNNAYADKFCCTIWVKK